MKKRIKKRIVKIHIYLATILACMTGCTLQQKTTFPLGSPILERATDNENSDSSVLEKLKEMGDELTQISRNITFSTATNLSTEEKSADYFERGKSVFTSYDDIVLTLEEKGIGTLSTNAIQAIKSISLHNQLKKGYDWENLFDIDSIYKKAFTNVNTTTKVKKHSVLDDYDFMKGNIDWEKLVDVIFQNSVNRANKENELNNDSTIEFGRVEPLSREDIQNIIAQLKAFSEDVKKEYPDFDKEHFHCQLVTLSLTYREKIVENGKKLASTTVNNIEWYLDEAGNKPVLTTSLGLNDHEFKHFLCQSCMDELVRDKNCYIAPTGIIYKNGDALKFTFIEEATAEEFSAKRNHTMPVTYFDKIEILDTIRFVLSMQDDYEEDGFLKYSFYQNPIAMIEQFPVLESQTYYFVNNLKMLKAYDTCLSPLKTDFATKASSISGYGDFLENIDTRREVISSLATYSQEELSRLFFTNLVVLNDTKEDMTLSYNFYLMRIFERRMKIGFDAISSYQGYYISSANYDKLYEERLGLCLRYLSDRYQMELKTVRSLYDEYCLEDGIVYPEFVTGQKINFYQDLEKREYDLAAIQNQITSGFQYYIQYSE